MTAPDYVQMYARVLKLRDEHLTYSGIAKQIAKEFDGRVRSRERIRQIVARGQRLRAGKVQL